MIEDYIVSPRSAAKIEETALAWREALGVTLDWAPDILGLLENKLARFFPEFALIIRPDSEMGDAEAYTEFSPPQIVVRKSVYLKAAHRDGRSRMTLAHELGHLVMHGGVQSNPRMIDRNKPAPTFKHYESAEWQANKFASLFLMPIDLVRQFSSSLELAECCQVSQKAATIRFGQVERPYQKSLSPCIHEAIENLKQT